MNHFMEYFKYLQKFDLRLVETRDNPVSANEGTVYGLGYDSRDQKPYSSFEFKNHLRLLKDLAVVDLIGPDHLKRQNYLSKPRNTE